MTAAHRKLRARWGLPGVVVLATGLLAANIANAQETTFKVGISTDYSTGDYGTGQTVDIWSVPLTAKVENGRWSLELKVPYISINSAGDVVAAPIRPLSPRRKRSLGAMRVPPNRGWATLSAQWVMPS